MTSCNSRIHPRRKCENSQFQFEFQDLLDEHAQGLFVQLLNKIVFLIEYFYDNLGKEHILPVISVFGTIGFIVAVGYLLAYLVRIEEEDIQKKHNQKNNNYIGTSKAVPYVPELKLHELRAEKYNGLVRLLKPGCRTIILVTDLHSRPKLIPGFHKAVWPYRKYDSEPSRPNPSFVVFSNDSLQEQNFDVCAHVD